MVAKYLPVKHKRRIWVACLARSSRNCLTKAFAVIIITVNAIDLFILMMPPDLQAYQSFHRLSQTPLMLIR